MSIAQPQFGVRRSHTAQSYEVQDEEGIGFALQGNFTNTEQRKALLASQPAYHFLLLSDPLTLNADERGLLFQLKTFLDNTLDNKPAVVKGDDADGKNRFLLWKSDEPQRFQWHLWTSTLTEPQTTFETLAALIADGLHISL